MKFSKQITVLFILFTLLIANWAVAKGLVPYPAQVNNIMRYQRVAPNIATSGALDSSAIQELVKHGFRTVIDVRAEQKSTDSERLAIKKTDMEYFNIPVTREGIDESQLAAFKEVLAQATSPILLHCSTGNRAGAMWTVYRLSEGIPADRAFKEGRAAGMSEAMAKIIKEKWCQDRDDC
ncbi:MAG TPA: sulfur transferase domain-containing protein [Nitrosomonas mobilis]|nr:sulfur transferase domain-containing protein [Nitrosomonas mobilis]